MESTCSIGAQRLRNWSARFTERAFEHSYVAGVAGLTLHRRNYGFRSELDLMREEHTSEQRKLMNRWLEMSDEALRDSRYEGVSEYTRCSAAFDSGYTCALYLIGPEALTLDVEHPSARVLRKAAEAAGVDVGPALVHLGRQLHDPMNMPSLSAMLAWAHVMRRLVPIERL